MQDDKIKVKLTHKEAIAVLNFAEYYNDGMFVCNSFKEKLIDIEHFKHTRDIEETVKGLYEKMLRKTSINE